MEPPSQQCGDRAKLRPGDELTVERIEQDAWVCRQWPCATEYYKAQMELNRQRCAPQARN